MNVQTDFAIQEYIEVPNPKFGFDALDSTGLMDVTNVSLC